MSIYVTALANVGFSHGSFDTTTKQITDIFDDFSDSGSVVTNFTHYASASVGLNYNQTKELTVISTANVDTCI